MTEWFNLAPIGGWERAEECTHRVTFEYPDTRERLIAFRILGPGGNDGGYREDYVLRYIPADREGVWEEVVTVKDVSSLERACRESMQQLSV